MTLLSRKHIDDHDMVARYLANQLTDDERTSFEAFYLEHPELLRELNTTAQFKSGLMDLRQSGELDELLKQHPTLQSAGGVAMAASIVFAIIVGSFLLYRQSDRPILAASVTALSHRFQSTLSIADSYDIQRTRTSSYDATITLPANSSAIELRVKPEVTAVPARYRIALSRIAADDSVTELATTGDLQPTKSGFVTIYLNAAKLSPAIYELKISGDTDTTAANTVSSFLVEVTPAHSE